MKEIKLTQDQVALVDDEDLERVNQYNWCASWNPSTKSFYAIRSERSTGVSVKVHMSHFVLECQNNIIVDHKNHDTLDNQKHNLRECTSSQNGQNRKVQEGYSSQYKGVCWYSKTKKWNAQIRLKDVFNQSYKKHLGYFDIEEEAALAYDKAARYHFGEFAYLNFPTRDTDV